jgi:multidrug efflux pump subunit AcrB
MQRVLDRTVWSQGLNTYIPMRQVVDSFDLTGEETLIYRRDRVPMLTARSNHPLGTNFDAEFAKVRPLVEDLQLPIGYHLTWGGEYEGSQEARETLSQRIPITFGIMFFVTVLLFGKLKQPIIIWLTVPMTVCGVVISLLVTDLSFTFPSFLGFLSLSGMLIKNCVVLVDEIDKRVAEQGLTQAAIISASVSRLRPVVLAAGTTIVGMTPLLSDAFFLEMAVCIMGGLAFSTILIMFAIPLLYWLVRPSAPSAALTT